jgi:hypothetical protein
MNNNAQGAHRRTRREGNTVEVGASGHEPHLHNESKNDYDNRSDHDHDYDRKNHERGAGVGLGEGLLLSSMLC